MKHLPIISPRFLQTVDFPSHVRGPNYARPVFNEYGEYGNWQPSPIFVHGGKSLAGADNMNGIFGGSSLGASGEGDGLDYGDATDTFGGGGGGTTSTAKDYGFGDLLKNLLTGATTAACNSPAVIKAVQTKIGTTADGQWGPASQAKLIAAGFKTFQEAAPGCTGAAPGATGGGGGGTTTTTTGGGKPVTGGGTGVATASMFSNPMTWIVVAAVAAGGIIVFGKKKKPAAEAPLAANRRRRRRRSR